MQNKKIALRMYLHMSLNNIIDEINKLCKLMYRIIKALNLIAKLNNIGKINLYSKQKFFFCFIDYNMYNNIEIKET